MANQQYAPSKFPPTADIGHNGTIQNIIWCGQPVPAYGVMDQVTRVFLVQHIQADTDFELGLPDGIILGQLSNIRNGELLQLLSKNPGLQSGILAKIHAAHGRVIGAPGPDARVRAAFAWFRNTRGMSVADAKAIFNVARRKNGLNNAGDVATHIGYTNEGPVT